MEHRLHPFLSITTVIAEFLIREYAGSRPVNGFGSLNKGFLRRKVMTNIVLKVHL